MTLPRSAKTAAVGLLVAALTLALYAQTLGFQFVGWDDGGTIYQNPGLGPLSWSRVRWAFTDTASTMRWIPFTMLSHALTYTFFGLDPFGYHLANWLLHAATAALVFLGLREVLRPLAARRGLAPEDPWILGSAAAGALLWSFHPLRVEVVAWCNSRGHAQAAFFTVLSLVVYLRAHRPERAARGPVARTAPAAAWYLAALLSHPIAVGALPIFPLLDVHLGRLGGEAGWWSRAARRVLLEKLPLALAAAAALGIALYVRTFDWGRWEPPISLERFGLFPRIMQPAWIVVQFMAVTIWPAHLHPAPPDLIDFDPASAPFLLRAALVVAVSAALVVLRRRWPGLLLLWLGYLVLLVPTLGLTEHPTWANDRYANLPALAWAAGVAAVLLLLGAARARRPAVAAAAVAVILAAGAAAFVQSRHWRDTLTLYDRMLAELGDHVYRVNVLVFRAGVYLERGDANAAVQDLRRADAAYEDSIGVPIPRLEVKRRLAWALLAAGRGDEAVAHLAVAAAQRPDVDVLGCELGAALARLGRAREAEATAREILARRPGSACALQLLASAQGWR